jgi:hypothetical protein
LVELELVDVVFVGTTMVLPVIIWLTLPVRTKIHVGAAEYGDGLTITVEVVSWLLHIAWSEQGLSVVIEVAVIVPLV